MDRLLIPLIAAVIGVSVAAWWLIETSSGGDMNTQAASMTEMEYYVGKWQSETRQAQDGRDYYFHYELTYFDANQTMIEMTITQHFEDGSNTLLWSGFKGLDPIKNNTYYYGFSPSGRVGRGEVVVEGDTLVTQYEGFGPQGNGVMIRDVFTVQDNDHFVSITYMLQEDEWQEVWRDHWERILA